MTRELHVRADADLVAQLKLATGGLPEAALVRAGLTSLRRMLAAGQVDELLVLAASSVRLPGPRAGSRPARMNKLTNRRTTQ